MSERHVITAEELKARALREVEIQGFEEGQEPIVIRIRSLSIMKLVSTGKIPNQLMATALELFEGKKNGGTGNAAEAVKAMEDSSNLTNMASLIDVICENAMVEPSFADVGDYLTDEQKLAIFQYTQGGVVDLKSFRKEQTNQ